MSNAIATAYVQVIPTTEGIKNNLTSLLSSDAKTAGSEAGTQAGTNLASKLKKAIVAAGIGAAVTGAVKGVAKAIGEVASAGDTIDKQSQKIGVTAEQYQALSSAAEHCGFSTSVFSMATKKLQQQNYDGTIYDFMNALQKIEDPTERAAKAQEVLGEKTANEMAAFINGSDTMDDYYDNLEKIGGMMSGDAVKAAAAYEDALTDMNAAIQGGKNAMIAELLPACTEVMNGITALASGDSSGFGMIKQGVVDFATTIGSTAVDLITKGGEMVTNFVSGISTKLPNLITKGGEFVTNAITGLIQKLPTIITKGGELITKFVGGMMASFPSIIKTGGDMIVKISTAIVDKLPDIAGSAAKVIAKFVSTVASNLPQILQTGVEVMSKVVAGLIQAIPKIPGAVLKAVNKVKSEFKKVKWGEIGKNIIKGVASGIKNAVGTIVSAAKEAAKSAFNAAKNALGIHSPSRLFRDEVGKRIAQGWALGISDNEGIVTKAMDQLSDASINTANVGVSAFSGRTEGSFDELIGYLKKTLPEIGKRDIYLDTGKLVGATVGMYDTALSGIYTAKGRGR